MHYSEKDLRTWAPITKQHIQEGMTIEELAAAAISYSDNTAMNLLAQEIGGPAGINDFARSIQDNSFQLDHWWPEEAASNVFDGKDSSTPSAMAKSLQRLILGNTLATPQREALKTWLIKNTTGDARIRAGTPKGWVVGDKTGTGSFYGTANDIAIIWPKNCAPLVIAIFTTSTHKNASFDNHVVAAATDIIIHQFAQTNSCIQQALS
jgi:beta-lactamase class A